MDTTLPKLPTHELVYRDIREMILCGELEPGQAVTIQGLVADLGVGMTPVREAIRRLTAENALEFLGNRRVCVPILTPSQLDELEFARLALEPQLAFWAAPNMGASDVQELRGIDGEVNRAIDRGDVRGYLFFNHQFHSRFYAASGATLLASVVDGLWLRMGPSLRVMGGRFGTSNLPDKHADAIAALANGDATGVRDAIHEDIKQGFDGIRAALTR